MTYWNVLVLDIKCHIANFDAESWYHLYRYDPEFRSYSQTPDGIKIYKRLFNIMTQRIEHNCIIQKWTMFGRLHRENTTYGVSLPAYYDGFKRIKYYYNGLLHRDNDYTGQSLPADIYSDDLEYINDRLNGIENDNNIHHGCFSYTHYKYGVIHRDPDENGIEHPAHSDLLTTTYYKNGLLHRSVDEPAVISINGGCTYCKNGQIHRDRKNGKSQPAITDTYGTKEYFRRGLRHRSADKKGKHKGKHKPAIITQNGSPRYFNNGIEYFL